MKIKDDCKKILEEFYSQAKLQTNSVLVVGCSTSEVGGSKIGKNSNIDIAHQIFDVFYHFCKKNNIFLAAQCCEHLNRCIVIEKEAIKDQPIVNVVPQIKAGGAFATTAYQNFKNPVVIENIQADAGIDIGDTLIGMHLKPVAVPVRVTLKKIGEANVVCARTRPKFVGGIRAIYDENLL